MTGRLCLHRQYYWYDERGKKVKCTAPQYVDFVMSSVQKLVTDEDVFPTKYGTSLPWCWVLLPARWAWLRGTDPWGGAAM